MYILYIYIYIYMLNIYIHLKYHMYVLYKYISNTINIYFHTKLRNIIGNL